jgi:hypothetical protein
MTVGVIVENESDVAEEIERQLKLGGIQTVYRFRTEFAFRKAVADMAGKPVAIALFDVMLNWSTPEDFADPAAEDPPPEVRAELSNRSKKRGGLRSIRLFQSELERAGKTSVPTILYTMLEASDLAIEIEDLNVRLITKAGVNDPKLKAVIRETLRQRTPS